MKVNVSDRVIFEKLDGQVIMLDLGGGTYYKLNWSGSEIWTLIRQHGDLTKVEDSIVERYDVDRNSAREQVARLVDELENRGLLVVDRG